MPVLRPAARGYRALLPGPQRQPQLTSSPPPRHAGFQPELRIDWLESDELAAALPGRLGLTFLPGKHGASTRYPGHVYQRDTASDLATMRADGISLLVLLVEDAELRRWGDPRIAELAHHAGLALVRYPIADGAPAPSIAEMDAIQQRIEAGRAQGDVAVACMGGVGRSGMVAACALVRAGCSAELAIARVRQLRHPTAVETAEQERFVRDYAAAR